jgi:hypothetical protein
MMRKSIEIHRRGGVMGSIRASRQGWLIDNKNL